MADDTEAIHDLYRSERTPDGRDAGGDQRALERGGESVRLGRHRVPVGAVPAGRLGEAVYGVWALIGSVFAYAVVFQLGLVERRQPLHPCVWPAATRPDCARS
jgi:hypothetical protein